MTMQCDVLHSVCCITSNENKEIKTEPGHLQLQSFTCYTTEVQNVIPLRSPHRNRKDLVSWTTVCPLEYRKAHSHPQNNLPLLASRALA